MKFESFTNIDNVRYLHARFELITRSLNEIDRFLANKDKYHLSAGESAPSGKKSLYNLHVMEHSDGSGSKDFPVLELTGLKLHFKLYEFLKKELEAELEVVKQEIEKL